jgi:hypothetical protein
MRILGPGSAMLNPMISSVGVSTLAQLVVHHFDDVQITLIDPWIA